MKAIEIAQNNHVSFDDILIICRELNIPCTDENTEIKGNDVFLVEKRIETIKTQKIKEAQDLIKKNAEMREGKKIRLKRKVHVSKELIKDKSEEEAKQEKNKVPETKPAIVKEVTNKAPQDANRPADENRKKGGEIRELRQGRKRDDRPERQRDKSSSAPKDLKELFKPKR
jgi:hypothetical protein